jgi:poly-gamma-glutamate synthesis protein (capsule biosynthesis protein)
VTADQNITLMLCGDVMTGRGIDQVLPHPGAPVLYEPYVKTAEDYVRLAEHANGQIERPVSFSYVWGEACEVLGRRRPDLRIINLETAVTRSDRPWPKGINYRMNPANVPCLVAANIDCCVLANNHVIDWGREGLVETLQVLQRGGLKTVGAGHDALQAAAPAILPVAGKGRVLVYAFACSSSGVPAEWAATADRAGVNFLADLSEAAIEPIAVRIRRDERPGDIVLCSLHWGPNWGYQVPADQRDFAHWLIDRAGVDIVCGHSSHHAKAIEVYRGKPIFYGCGDFLNDYEGIENHEGYRADLVLMYIAEMGAAGERLISLDLEPFRIRNFRLNRADREEAEWLRRTMDRECGRFGGTIRFKGDASLTLTHRGPIEK